MTVIPSESLFWLCIVTYFVFCVACTIQSQLFQNPGKCLTTGGGGEEEEGGNPFTDLKVLRDKQFTVYIVFKIQVFREG